MLQRGQPVLVLQNTSKRDQGHRAQLSNIQAGKTVADIIRTTLGPRSMLKMLLDPMGGIVLTNDGNSILREIDVSHPAAKAIIELSRTQDEEVGDGTTSVVVVAGEILALSEQLLERGLHPTHIVSGFLKALEDCLNILQSISVPLDLNDDARLSQILTSCLSTKFSSHWGELIPRLALTACRSVVVDLPNGRKDVDIKKYAKVEKIAGGEIEESCVLQGIMLNKDVTHPRMRRRIVNPRVLLLDCPLEYKKGESQTTVEITKEEEWQNLLQQEEAEVKKMCDDIIRIGCDVVITEKGISDLAQHFLMKGGISALRRTRKTDNNRLARATGATIVYRTDEITSEDIGHNCRLFEVKKIGDEYYAHFVQCKDPKACTIVLRGGSKDVLNEAERNFQDALHVARQLFLDPRLVPGGGACEMELSARLTELSTGVEGLKQWPYRAVAAALEVIPRTLFHNCGAHVVRGMTDLRARHASSGSSNIGIDGVTGAVVDVVEKGIWDTLAVKQQILKTAIEAAAVLIRIDDVLSAVSTKDDEAKKGGEMPSGEM